MAARTQATPCGGIGQIQELVRSVRLAESINEHVHVFKKHFPKEKAGARGRTGEVQLGKVLKRVSRIPRNQNTSSDLTGLRGNSESRSVRNIL
jgi:hypothetical protein